MLRLILDADSPILAEQLAKHLQISKRTVFRELENVNLSDYNLRLETKSKKGMSISGAQSDKDKILQILNQSEHIDPKNIEERHSRLILELLNQEEPQKIYCFAQMLQVSESTINSDLDSVEKWFSLSRIQLVRKPGLGIYISYKEENFRKACMRYVHQSMDSVTKLHNLIPREIVDCVAETINMTHHTKLVDMADFSYIGLILFLSIATHRILQDKCILEYAKVSPEEKDSEDWGFVRQIVGILEKQFDITFPPAEADYFFVYVKGARLQHADRINPIDGYFDLQCMIYDMINQYDPAISFDLKNDKEFINGLIAHISPTIVRLQSGHEIYNPFQQEVLSQYPEIYAKTRKAVEVLERTLHCVVPDDEIGLLALHFGGASVRLKNSDQLRRKIHVGVVCASGIGVSTLLSSRLSHIFRDKINVRPMSQSELAKNGMIGLDIVISTMKLPLPEDQYLIVHPMLNEQDVANVSEKISALSFDENMPAMRTTVNLISHVDEIKLISSEIGSLLRRFRLYHVPHDISFDELMRTASKFSVTDDAEWTNIYHALIKRESLHTQIIPEYEIVFLHAKTEHVKESIFMLLRPADCDFSDLKLAGIKSVIVMLIPENDTRRTLAISSISIEIFENDSFLEMIKFGEEEQISQHIEKILNHYLVESINYFRI